MSRSSQSGYLAIGPQVSKGVMPGSPVFYKYRATDIDFGAVEPGGLLPPEIASIITPTGAYKLATFGAGGFSIIPRLADNIGWLLFALMGAVTSTEQETSVAYDHVFKFAADATSLPWSTIRKEIPSSGDAGESVLDCKIARARFTIPQAGPIAARFDAVGRVPSFPEGYTWTTAALDDGDSFPVAGSPGSFVKLPSFSASALPATGCIVEMINMMTTPQQELVIGAQYPDDFVVLQRVATVRFVYKWEDPALCRTIMTGAATGSSTWTPKVYTSDFKAVVKVADPIALGTQPQALTFDATKVQWEPNGPIRLVGNNILAQEYVGTALEPAAGEYFSITLRNGEDAYVWPVA